MPACSSSGSLPNRRSACGSRSRPRASLDPAEVRGLDAWTDWTFPPVPGDCRLPLVCRVLGYLGDPVSFSLTGIAAQGLGASSTFLFGGGFIMVAVIISWVSPAVRSLSLPGTGRRS